MGSRKFVLIVGRDQLLPIGRHKTGGNRVHSSWRTASIGIDLLDCAADYLRASMKVSIFFGKPADLTERLFSGDVVAVLFSGASSHRPTHQA